MKRAFFICFILLTVAAGKGFSQYYVTGQDQASLKWKQIKTSHFNLIFPETFSGMADHYATLLEKSYSNALTLYPETKADIPVIIHNYSMQSNGYVSWAPKRMELYPLPGQDNLPDDPSQLLIMHEMIHVAQISSLNYGFTKALSFILGEQAVGLASATIPEWALEGDAVYSETLFSNSGRGRTNSFIQGQKSIIMCREKRYDYSKMLFGSYRDFTPDHYVFGFEMMNYLHSYQKGFWESNMAVAGRRSYLIIPTNIMLKNKLDMNKKGLYNVTLDSLKRTFEKAEKEYPFAKYAQLNHDKEGEYENYHSPYMTQTGEVIALKTSLSEPQHFVLVDPLTGAEKKLLTTGYLYPSLFSYSNEKIVWAELHNDPRWENRDFSVIKTLDLKTGKVRQLSFRSRYSAPSFSPDGSSIVAVNTSPELVTSLVFIDAVSGEVTDNIITPDNVFLQMPSWTSDQRITAISLSNDGEGVICYDKAENKWDFLVKPSHTDITQAQLSGSELYILLQDKNSDNIYCRKSDGTLRQISFSRFGVSSFSVTGDNILFSDYTYNGFSLSSISINDINDSINTHYINSLSYASENASDTLFHDSLTYQITPYKPFKHLFRIHSWAPFYFNTDEVQTNPESINPGFTLLSQNTLSTLISTFGYEYSDGLHILHSDISWQGSYPVINAGISYGKENLFTTASDNNSLLAKEEYIKSFHIEAYLPLYFAYNKFSQIVMPSVYIEYVNNLYYISDIESYQDKYTFLTPRLYLSNTFRKAYRDIYPRWGQIVVLQATISPWEKQIYHPLAGFKSTFFFPGLMKNHSIMVKAGYEDQSPVRRSFFSNINSFPRGYHEMVSIELKSFSGDYTFPLFYPDLSAGSILYLKRIRGSFYYDWVSSTGTFDAGINKYYSGTDRYISTGGELLADFYVLRFPYEISAGACLGYLIPEEKPFVEAVFSVNVYGSIINRKK